MSSKDQLAIVQKYEVFLNYFYPIAQNIPRKHGVAHHLRLARKARRKNRDYLLDDLLS